MGTLAAPVLLCGMFVGQCPGPTPPVFVQVSENGFDAEDNAIDFNHYAWAMRYFKPDDAETGRVYVGTGNNIAGLVGFYFQVLASGGEIIDAPVRPPEIRRYRPDLGLTSWEKVFDYRDETPGRRFDTTGFRFMDTYRAVDSEGKGRRSTYLYAATQGVESVLWRSKSGDYGDWEAVFSTADAKKGGDEINFGASIRWFAEHKGKLYLGFAFDTFEEEPPPGEIWVSEDGLNFEPVIQDGFGNPNNRGIEFLISWNDWLYAGTKNDVEGYEVWKLDGPEKGVGPIRVIRGGATDPRNEIAGTPVIFKGHLYIGSIIFFGFNPRQLQGFKGCDIIRLDTNDEWEVVVGPNSLSGYDSGFNHFTNAYCWWMEEYDGWLYASTWDQGTVLSWMLDNLPALIEFIQNAQAQGKQLEIPLETFYEWTHAGADIFRTNDGVHWYPVTIDGFGDPGNYGWRTMEATPDGYLFVGSANPVDGLEVWRTGPAK